MTTMAKIEDGVSERPVRAADRIRETARDLFYREGIRAVGVDEIVTRAGVTKPSLYRSFGSKEDLVAAYLRDYDADYWQKFDAVMAEYAGDPRAQLMAWFTRAARRVSSQGYRGCGMTNAAVEYPEPGHPGRQVAEANKTELRRRLIAMAEAIGAKDPATLGDGLLLLLEGAYVMAQLLGADGPAPSVAAAAEALIEGSLKD
ncbi:MAG: TetR/AcrR family transcriptional regulator [Alphaproteobacteria bacterium]|nr:TetR/AcrR family transcriptional regulator [Alphaproteobacteria bacterium]